MFFFTSSRTLRLFIFLFIGTLLINDIQAQGIYQNWGVTLRGGQDNLGVIFSTDGSGTNLTGRTAFTLTHTGTDPQYGSMTDFEGKLYGLASGVYNNEERSTLFEFDPATGEYLSRLTLYDNNNIRPVTDGSLTVYNGQLYGVSRGGGGKWAWYNIQI